jgi:HlyD family secretion protein
MIKNSWLVLGLLALLGPAALSSLGCRVARSAEATSTGLQGVVELEETPVGFELSGRLTQLLVEEGDVIQAGAVLARIDDGLEQSARNVRLSEAQVAQQQAGAVKAGARGEEVSSLASRVAAARATEELLMKQAARERALLEKGVIAAAAVDDVEGQLARARAERESLEHNLKLLRQGARREDVSVATARAEAATAAVQLNDARLVRHELRAPIAGTVLDVNFELGEVVAAASPVVTLADTHRPYVDVFVPQSQISAVKLRQSARIKVDALATELSGEVEHIARRTEFTPRYLFSERERSTLVVRVRVRILDPKEQLRAGVPAVVRFGGK